MGKGADSVACEVSITGQHVSTVRQGEVCVKSPPNMVRFKGLSLCYPPLPPLTYKL